MKSKFLLYAFLALASGASAQNMDWLCNPGQYKEVGYLGYDLFKVKGPEGKWGILNARGEVPVEARYDSITPFVENKALLLQFDRGGQQISGIINNRGEMVKDLSAKEYYAGRYPNFKEGRLVFRNREGLYGYLNEQGDISIMPDYCFAAPFQDGIAAVQYQTYDYGLINKSGRSAIVSNTKYPFISSPVNGKVLAVTGSSRGGSALHLFRIDGASLKKEKTYENGVNIWLSDDFTTLECQKGSRYFIDNQWRVSGSNTSHRLPEVAEEPQPFQIQTSTILGVSTVEDGLRITYLGNPIVNNVFPEVATYDNYAIVRSRDNRVGVLRLNKSAAIEITPPSTPVVFYHNTPTELLLDVNLMAVNPNKLHWYRNDTGYLTHSSLEFNDGKYQLRMPYYKTHANAGELESEEIDIAFTYDGLDWMHHTFSLESMHVEMESERFEITVSGNTTANSSGFCNLTISINSLNGPADGTIRLNNGEEMELKGDRIEIPVRFAVPDRTEDTKAISIEIKEPGFPVLRKTIYTPVRGYHPPRVQLV